MRVQPTYDDLYKQEEQSRPKIPNSAGLIQHTEHKTPQTGKTAAASLQPTKPTPKLKSELHLLSTSLYPSLSSRCPAILQSLTNYRQHRAQDYSIQFQISTERDFAVDIAFRFWLLTIAQYVPCSCQSLSSCPASTIVGCMQNSAMHEIERTFLDASGPRN
ncbi:hypothetical protein AHF37_04976 [Paragonimus kellicotti]|nr:hypothetical protein AHF37_04976 [Paragonimus kellicotti]